LTLSSFSDKDSIRTIPDTVTVIQQAKSDTLQHKGEITIKTARENSTLIDILSSPFSIGLIGLLASIVGFWFNDYLNRRNQLRDYKNKLLNDFSRVMTLTIMFSNQAKIKENWINFYNACKTQGIKPIPKDQIMREHERLDYLSNELLKLTAELNGLRSQFEYKISKGQDKEFDKLIWAFHSVRIKFTGMDFDNMNQVQLAAIQPKLSEMVQQQISDFRATQENALNDVMNYLSGKIK